MIEAILAGEHDPLALAKLRNPNITASAEPVAKSLHDRWREEHLLVLRLTWETHAHRMQITTLKSTVGPSRSRGGGRSPHPKREKGANPRTNRS